MKSIHYRINSFGPQYMAIGRETLTVLTSSGDTLYCPRFCQSQTTWSIQLTGVSLLSSSTCFTTYTIFPYTASHIHPWTFLSCNHTSMEERSVFADRERSRAISSYTNSSALARMPRLLHTDWPTIMSRALYQPSAWRVVMSVLQSFRNSIESSSLN